MYLYKHFPGSQKIKNNHFQRFDVCIFRETLIVQFTLKFLYIIHYVKSLTL